MERRMQMAQINLKSQAPSLLRLEPFLGIDVTPSSSQINDHESPDMLNMWIDERGSLNKRTGYQRVFPTSLGAGQINGLYEYKKSDGTSVLLIAWGSWLYTQSGNNQPVVIYSGLNNQKVFFFTMNGKCYIMDGAKMLVYDGTTVAPVTPYIPTIQISKLPAGGGTPNEDFNLIGNKFKDSFSGDGSSKLFQLSLTNLDATTVTAVVNGSTITEGSGLTVDRAKGQVTFTTAPATGTNNVIITAGKAVSGYPDQIFDCTTGIAFGGANDTRMFVTGNPNMPEYIWRSGLYDPTYWPENGFYKFPDRIKGFSKQYDYLVIHRENGIHQVQYQIDSNTGIASFPSKPINDEIGTYAPNSIQIIENNPTFLSKDGVYTLTNTNVRDERNVQHISLTVDRKLLLETGLNQAVSIDYDKKYWLAVNGNVYVLDYAKKTPQTPFGKWYIYNNIPASCFLEMGGFLYFGSSNNGMVYQFQKDTSNANSYNDDGQPIVAYWKSKELTFGAEERYKRIENVFMGLKPSGATSLRFSYETDKKQGGGRRIDAVLFNFNNIDFTNFTFFTDVYDEDTVKANLFDFNTIDFRNFSFQFSSFPQEFKKKINANKVTYFQLTVSNDRLNEGLTIFSLVIKYTLQNFIR